MLKQWHITQTVLHSFETQTKKQKIVWTDRSITFFVYSSKIDECMQNQTNSTVR